MCSVRRPFLVKGHIYSIVCSETQPCLLWRGRLSVVGGSHCLGPVLRTLRTAPHRLGLSLTPRCAELTSRSASPFGLLLLVATLLVLHQLVQVFSSAQSSLDSFPHQHTYYVCCPGQGCGRCPLHSNVYWQDLSSHSCSRSHTAPHRVPCFVPRLQLGPRASSTFTFVPRRVYIPE